MSEMRLDWAAAEVKDGELRVPLSEKAPDGWREHFATTVRLLGGGQWGQITVKKRHVHVAEVEPGDEEKIRLFLEGACDQANAAEAPDEDEDAESEDEAQNGPDAELTSRFRAFAADGDDAEQRGD